MRAVLRSATLVLPALCALASCGIPTTGVVEAGGPAGGIVPTTSVYFVADGTLVPVPRRMVATVGVEPAVLMLLQGPTEKERLKGLDTLLPRPLLLPSAADTYPPTASVTPAPTDPAGGSGPVKVTSDGGHVVIELSLPTAKPADLAAAQLICTAVAAQRLASPGTEPLPVTVTGPDGRHTEGSGKRCPAG
ncbi:hypothetical protein [Streptomyces sp. NPDC001480]|uniref:hypothetical protein n=1 Tax=Streptomyces sp. NPDC001480 TaxID=3364577 RepID=UPI003677AF6A